MSRWFAPLTVLAMGLLGLGIGPTNGDAAVYVYQASAGVLHERVVHIGYLAPASLLAMVVPNLALALDVANLLCASLLVLLVSRWASAEGRGVYGGWVAAAAVLPLASWAEVDLLWAVLFVGAVRAPTWAAGLLAGLAATVSPTALLALPWLIWARWPKGRKEALLPVAGALFAVAALSLGSAGAWWVGDRGVLSGPSPLPLRSLWVWSTLPVVSLPIAAALWTRSTRVAWGIAAGAIALLAPPDVPGWLPVLCGVAALVPWQSRVGLRAVVLCCALLGTGLWWVQRARVTDEAAIVEVISQSLGPHDGLVASWSWGVRVSLVSTGDPYALRWTHPVRPVRNQASRWCADPPQRVAWLPPGDGPRDIEPLMVDAIGVSWFDAPPPCDEASSK